jgi:hypothetical protein
MKRTNKMAATRHMNNENAPNGEDWIEKAGSITQAFSKLLSKSACKMCNVYVDEQVEFENRQEDYTGTMAKVWLRAYKPSLDVELYRQFLFDEESVVDNVCERDEEPALNTFEHEFGRAPTQRHADEGSVTTQKTR